MHGSVLTWVRRKVREHGLAGRTVEVGSYDVNGSVRSLFPDAYVGVDMRPGPGVDVVALGSALPFVDGWARVVVSTEMLEHDPTPWLSVAEMARVLDAGGHLLLTGRGYDERGCFPLHDYPQDLYRFSVGGVDALLRWAGLRPLEVSADPEAPGVFALAVKEG